MKVELIKNSKLSTPRYATEQSAGMDIFANIMEETANPEIKTPGYNLIGVGESAIIKTGLFVAIPPGYEIQIRPRSGLAAKHQVTVLNTPGTIDADYRGEIGVILINHGESPFKVEHGERIAQMVMCKVETIEFEIVETLSETGRGEGGFGSTGTK